MNNTRYFRNIVFNTAVLSLVFLLVVTRAVSIPVPDNGRIEKNSRNAGDTEKKSGSSSLDVYTPITVFQTHFDHSCRIIFALHFEIISGIGDLCFHPDFLNNYFHALFQFIIATKAP